MNLKDVEKRTYVAYHQDGLIDIFLGVYILTFAAGVIINNILEISTWFIGPAILPAIMVPLWISIKKKVTIPRIGYVKFKTNNISRVMGLFLGTLVSGVLFFLLFAFGSTQSWVQPIREIIISNSMVVIGVATFAIASVFAYVMGLKRMGAYGVLALTLFTAGQFIVLPFEYIVLTIGATTICYGVILLWKFTKKYPLTHGD